MGATGRTSSPEGRSRFAAFITPAGFPVKPAGVFLLYRGRGTSRIGERQVSTAERRGALLKVGRRHLVHGVRRGVVKPIVVVRLCRKEARRRDILQQRGQIGIPPPVWIISPAPRRAQELPTPRPGPQTRFR